MRAAPLLLLIVGALILLAGIVFVLQGEGIVGPDSSFMFNNPTWIYQGIGSEVVGLLIVVAGLFLSRRRPSVGQ